MIAYILPSDSVNCLLQFIFSGFTFPPATLLFFEMVS